MLGRRREAHSLSQRVLDPLDRTSEILLGLIIVLTLTGSIRVAEAGREDLRTVLEGAIGGGVAWGLIDAAMYVTAAFMARARRFGHLKAIRQTSSPETARRLIVDLLPSELSSVLTPTEVEMLRQRLNQQDRSSEAATLTRADFLGATGVFLLVFLSTVPLIVPLIVVRETRLALRLSNALAVLMLFVAGWSLGRHAGRPAWRAGLGMVAIGLVLVAITMALGG